MQWGDCFFVCPGLIFFSAACLPDQPPQDPLLQLVSLQKASGYWLLDSPLAAALGKTIDELQNAKPEAKSNKEVF